MNDPIDLHAGARMRHIRKLRGHSQAVLAEALGVTFQQVQKYERGSNRISFSTLYRAAKFLGVPIGYFAEGLETGPDGDAPDPAMTAAMDLVREMPDFAKIGRMEPPQRRAVRDLVNAMVQGDAVHG